MAICFNADDRIESGRGPFQAESFHDHTAAFAKRFHACLAVDGNDRHAFRNTEINGRFVFQCLLHEFLEYRRSQGATGGAFAHWGWLVIANKNARNQIGSIANEPGIFFFIGRTGLAGGREPDVLDVGR